MPVSLLLVEGKLDIEILNPLLAGMPAIDPRPASKGSLAPRARDLRRDTGQKTICYVRDRDFDFLPPADLSHPTVDASDSGTTLGWRWCRHEIENYLIDPDLVHAALGWDPAALEGQLVAAAQRLKHYQAARWTIGMTRRVLPPVRAYPTRPAECHGHDLRLPADLTLAGTENWVHSQTSAYLADIDAVLGPANIGIELANHSSRLTDVFFDSVENVLVWCSGKDLLAALRPWLQATHNVHPTQFRERMRDWIAANADATLVLLPEWEAFRNLLRTYPK